MSVEIVTHVRHGHSPTVYHVISTPWPMARAYHEAWRAAGYTGLIYIAQLRAWRPYRRGWYVRSGATLQAASAHVGLESLGSRAGLRLAAALHHVATGLARCCRRYERWRLMRRARRVLAERS